MESNDAFLPSSIGSRDEFASISIRDFPLQTAAKLGRHEQLSKLIKSKNVYQLDYKGRTCLHWACSFPNHQIALKLVQIILQSDQISREKHGIGVTKNFVDIQDKSFETALHLAAKNECKKICEMLIFTAADVNLKSADGKEPLCLIYEKVPNAMVSVLNAGISMKDGEFEASDENLKIMADFGAIIGYDPPSDAKDAVIEYPRETELLAYALDCSPDTSRDILTHPLVQLFLELKWHKIRHLFWLSIAFHIAWLLLYTVFIAEVYLQSCPYKAPTFNMTEEEMSKEILSKEPGKIARFSWFSVSPEYILDTKETQCQLNPSRQWVLYVLLAMTVIVGAKEIFEIASVRKLATYFKGMENIGQWLLLISTLVLAWPVVFSTTIQIWFYELAAFGIFVAWSLVLSCLGKHPRLGLHVEILGKVLKSFAMFMLTFCSLLIAFSLSLSLLLPGNESFISLPLAFIKIVVMMTGELDYESFFDDEKAPFPISGRIIYLFFVITVAIILFNLLIAFTIADVQGLQKRAEVNKLSNQLEQVFIMESFILSSKMQRLLCHRKSILKKFLVAPPNEDFDLTLEMSIKNVPTADLRKRIRVLAAINSSSDSFPSFDNEDLDETTKLVKAILKEVLKTKNTS